MIESIDKFISRYKKKIYLLAYKKVDILSLVEETLYVKSDCVEVFAMSSNTIRILKTALGTYYFRECSRREPFCSFLEQLIGSFKRLAVEGYNKDNFKQTPPIRTVYSEEEVEGFCQILHKAEETGLFIKEVRNINFFMKKSNFSLWQNRIRLDSNCLRQLGFENIPNEYIEIFAYFIAYISTSISDYNFHDFIKIGQYETFNLSRSISSFKVAQLFDKENLVTSAKIARVYIDDKEYIGVLSPEAPGCRGLDTDCMPSPKLQRDLCNLKILDTICYQKDHFANNYNVKFDEDGIPDGIVAFDNDAPWTFLPSFKCNFVSVRNGAKIIDKNGMINTPYIDLSFADSIINSDSASIYHTLSPYLNKLQVWALLYRIHLLKKALKKTYQLSPESFVNNDMWSSTTIDKEINGDYGWTYFKQFVFRKDIDQDYLNS